MLSENFSDVESDTLDDLIERVERAFGLCPQWGPPTTGVPKGMYSSLYANIR